MRVAHFGMIGCRIRDKGTETNKGEVARQLLQIGLAAACSWNPRSKICSPLSVLHQ
jgi:hypothetical protein